MKQRKTMHKVTGTLTLLAFLSQPSAAFAYNNFTHQNFVNQAWQVMRATTVKNLPQKIKWKDPAQPPTTPLPSLDDPGDCRLPATDPRNLCGQTLSPEQWAAYVKSVGASLRRLNGLFTGLPTPTARNGSCGTSGTDSWHVGNLWSFSLPVSDEHMSSADAPCQVRNNFEGGVFKDFDIPDDGGHTQGAVLGWHAQNRDNDHSDTWVDMMPIVIGQVLSIVSSAFEIALGCILMPFICIGELIFGGDDCASDSFRFADKVNPIDVLKGIIPGWKNQDATDEGVGLWHFINVQPGKSNWYDDLQGMLYEEAGPNGVMSAIDMSIIIAGDTLFLNLDASNSAGTERYEITEDETSFANPSSDRANWSWQSETLGHTAFSPLDNFALFGHQRYVDAAAGGLFSAEPLGWPLHAIGDAHVPQHIVGTTGWGHRPFEDAVNIQWPRLVYEKCDDDSTDCNADDLKINQLRQAQKILQRGFRWRAFIASHPDIRDFITTLAQETRQLVINEPLGAGPGGIWCDVCSDGYVARTPGFKADVVHQLTIETDVEAFKNPVAYYDFNHHPRLYAIERDLVERSSGATLGYLLSIADISTNVCPILGESCTPGTLNHPACCGHGEHDEGMACGSQNKCCRSTFPAAACDADADCCSGGCLDGRCCAGVPEGAQCKTDVDCCGGVCNVFTDHRCRARTTGECHSNSECVPGQECQGGACRGVGGHTCTLDSQCLSQSCNQNAHVCRSTPDGPCATNSNCVAGYRCVFGACKAEAGGPCTSSDQCATLLCAQGQCVDLPPR